MTQPEVQNRYSGITRRNFRERLDRFRADPDPLNLLPEVALLRAQIEDLVERWDQIYGPDGALLAWFESFNDQDRQAASRPRRMPDRSAVSQLADRVGKLVERIHKMKSEGAVSLASFDQTVKAMGVALVEVVHQELTSEMAEKFLQVVEARWNSIRIDPDRH